MPNRYTTDKATIGSLLSLAGQPAIQVPEWQRNYSWTTSHVETFWQDLLAFSEKYPGDTINDQEYFLGSIVIVNDGSSLLLLDGQQRLATSTILLAVIRDSLRSFRDDAAVRLQEQFIGVFDDATDVHTYKITLNRYDREFFKRVVQEIDVAELPTATLDSHRLLTKAIEFLRARFRSKYDELSEGKEAFDWALRIRQVLTDHVSVVVVTSTDEDNAAEVFETLNDRGIGLSTTDLLRSLILRRAAEDDRDEIMGLWETVLEVAEDAKVEAFLRHYWLSHYGDVKRKSLYREIKEAILADDTDSLDFSRDLEAAANVYRDLVAARAGDDGLRKLLEEISTLGASALYPAVLSAYSLEDEGSRAALVEALIVFFVRHNVIGNRETTQLEAVVYGIAKDLRSNLAPEDAISAMEAAAPSDNEFVQQFKHVAVSRHATAGYLLRKLELSLRGTEELEIAAQKKVNVEHIYPKTPREGERRPDHASVVHRLGNITLLDFRLNAAIKNADFGTKKNAYKESQMILTQELLEVSEWDLDAINARQERLAGLAQNIWRFSSE